LMAAAGINDILVDEATFTASERGFDFTVVAVALWLQCSSVVELMCGTMLVGIGAA
jgi:hypothetical protein